MNTALTLITLYFVGSHCYVVQLQTHKELNKRPIVGVLSQEPDNVVVFPKQNYTSYIAASYVKNIEASGARVVPIMIGKDRSYYEKLLRKLNGVLFPGGDASLYGSKGYADAGQYIYEIAKDLNDAGAYFPLFGVCLGFELIVVLAVGRENKNVLTKCSSHNNLALQFSKEFRESKLFGDAPGHVIDILTSENTTVNVHNFCVVQETLKSLNLTKKWIPSSYSVDDRGVKFVSTIESIRYPIFGTQFHPEKVAFEWRSKKYVHSPESIAVNRYFMDFFVKESRKSLHRFSSPTEEDKYLIYNNDPIFTGKYKGYFDQTYMFEPRGEDSRNFTDLDLTPRISLVEINN